jgi:hypothetical protein
MKFGNMDEIDYMHDINMNNLEQTWQYEWMTSMKYTTRMQLTIWMRLDYVVS